ncbi:leucine--tRNA ligase [Candidatus Woesearchaeota archaeon]|nr:leucine--tRNA ligase [Candidatus Woesearchaeota archaeon]
MAEKIDFKAMAAKWQEKWADKGIFNVKEDPKRKKHYVLEMYPYPSASGLHMGHARNYVLGDVYSRFKLMKGFNVLHPMGFDSFGLPAENAAIKAKSHPKVFTEQAIENFVHQQKALGISYDWDRMIYSHDPAFYKWDQWIFLKMHEKGLVFKRVASVNWCPECNTVLANEQVHGGKCWRHEDTAVEVKSLSQWFFKITDYAEELLEGVDKLKDWPEDVKQMQRNWIGKSFGTLIDFKIEGSESPGRKLTVFTTRPDTLFGITFLVYAPEHPDVMELVKGTGYENKVKDFVNKVVLEDRFQRTAEDKEKEGMFIGRHAIHPVTGEKIPIYIANFVLYEYGTGAIIAVPAHDQRDFEFAKKYNIPIKVVINPEMYDLNAEKISRAYIGDGNMVNSGEFNGMNNRDAIPDINKFLEKNKFGKETVQYKLRDWLISRQRFWGCPIPIVYCDKCGPVAVPEKDLPVLLPEKVNFGETQGNPLASVKEFVDVKCPKCGGKARRETDTMDTFVDSSWYFLRYCDAKNDKAPFDKKKAAYWMPIDTYIGGKEHATMHLIYFRFFTKFFRDIDLLEVDEPAKLLFNQGMLHKDGVVMSKSKGNAVTQEDIESKYGIDTARFFLMFVASPDKDMEWDDETVEGSYRFIAKVYRMLTEKKITDKPIKAQESRMHKAIIEVTEGIDNFRYNLALISIMKLANYLHTKEEINKKAAEALLLLMAPFTPHIAEELWEKLGNKPFISNAKWPVGDKKKIDEKLEAAEELGELVRRDIIALQELTGLTKPSKIVIAIADDWKYDFMKGLKKEMEKTRNIGDLIKALCAKDKQSAKTIANLVPRFVKNPDKIPQVVLSSEIEKKALQACAADLEKEFKTRFEIVVEGVAKQDKAKNAMPGKPAIIFE